jgi:hypothetical protein
MPTYDNDVKLLRLQWALRLPGQDRATTARLHHAAWSVTLTSATDVADDHLRQAEAMVGDDPELIREHDYLRCWEHLRAGRFDQVLAVAQRWLGSGDPYERVAWQMMTARAAGVSGDYETARHGHRSQLTEGAKMAPMVLLEYANACSRLGDTRDALRYAIKFAETAALGWWEKTAIAEVIGMGLAAERLSGEVFAIIAAAYECQARRGYRAYDAEIAEFEQLRSRARIELSVAEFDHASDLSARLDEDSLLDISMRLANDRLSRHSASHDA